MSIILEVTKKDFTGTLYNDWSFFYSSKRTVSAKSFRLTLPFIYLIFPPPPLSRARIYRLQAWKQKAVTTRKEKYFFILFAVWISIPQIYIYILGIQHKLMVWPVCAPAVWIIDFPAQTSANIRPSRITDAQANIHLPWTLHTLYAKQEEGQVALAGWEKKENKEIYIAAAVQRLQEAWHVPICPAEVADSRNETIYHVDT